MAVAPERFSFSSDKCDFRLRGPNVNIVGRDDAAAASISTRLPQISITAGSDKCDWRVISRGALVESVAQVSQQAVNFGGRVAASSKCDWRINIERDEVFSRMTLASPLVNVGYSSSKCDWRLETAGSQVLGTFSGFGRDMSITARFPGVSGGFSSSKCDWRITSPAIFAAGPGTGFTEQLRVPMPGGRMRVDSDKCDFRIQVERQSLGGELRVAARDIEVSSHLGKVGAAAASSKCDWRIRAFDEIYTAAARSAGNRVDFEVSSRRFRGGIASSKCDWSIQATTSLPATVRRPELSANLTRQQKAFRMNVDLGLQGGPSIRLRVAGSDKCDFRVEDILESVDGRRWRKARLVRDEDYNK